jgi:hypothetical protein
VTDPDAWPTLTDDPELIVALDGPVDYQAAFDTTLDALLDHLLRQQDRLAMGEQVTKG